MCVGTTRGVQRPKMGRKKGAVMEGVEKNAGEKPHKFEMRCEKIKNPEEPPSSLNRQPPSVSFLPEKLSPVE